jgi:hypothetical protein
MADNTSPPTEERSPLSGHAHITSAWSGRHVWTIGGIEFVELRDVLDVFRAQPPEPGVRQLLPVCAAAEAICAHIGAHGSIDSRHPLTLDLLESLMQMGPPLTKEGG